MREKCISAGVLVHTRAQPWAPCTWVRADDLRQGMQVQVVMPGYLGTPAQAPWAEVVHVGVSTLRPGSRVFALPAASECWVTGARPCLPADPGDPVNSGQRWRHPRGLSYLSPHRPSGRPSTYHLTVRPLVHHAALGQPHIFWPPLMAARTNVGWTQVPALQEGPPPSDRALEVFMEGLGRTIVQTSWDLMAIGIWHHVLHRGPTGQDAATSSRRWTPVRSKRSR